MVEESQTSVIPSSNNPNSLDHTPFPGQGEAQLMSTNEPGRHPHGAFVEDTSKEFGIRVGQRQRTIVFHFGWIAFSTTET